MFTEYSKHIHFDAVYTLHKAWITKWENERNPIDYSQIIKDFELDKIKDEIEKRMIVLCPLEMDQEELIDREKDDILMF